jgi:hypothetical protein
MIRKMLPYSDQILIAALNKLNRCAKMDDVTCRQIKDDLPTSKPMPFAPGRCLRIA